ncbi:MAG: hypothetical protein ABJB11_19710 [Ferruginibacter sp.]
MLDGITIKYRIEDFEAWKKLTNLSFTNTVITDTGEISTKKRYDETITTHRAKWETFDLIVKEVFNFITGKKVFHLTIKGSLHKNHYGGKNYLPFTWQQLQQQINQICKTLQINPTVAQISTLEVGVNIVTPFEVTPFIMEKIINYKGDPFNRYEKDGNGFCLGIYCTLTQYVIKVYDKGLQNQLPQNLMRFEKRFLRMQVLNKMGIKFLSDLLNEDKIKKLLPMLLEAWQNVLIYDIEDLQKLTKTYNFKGNEIDLLTSGQNPKYWECLKKENKRQFNYQREKFKRLVAKNGANWQQLVNGLIQIEWKELFKNCTNLQSGTKEPNSKNCTNIATGENGKLYEFTIKVKGKNVQSRFCLSCGKDINNQKGGSKFCSAKYVGYEAAHQCRNNCNNRKYKIEKIQRRGVLFDIMPYFIPFQKQALNKKDSGAYF